MRSFDPEDFEYEARIREDDFTGNVTVEVTVTVRRAINFSPSMGLSKAEIMETAMQRMKHEFNGIFR